MGVKVSKQRNNNYSGIWNYWKTKTRVEYTIEIIVAYDTSINVGFGIMLPNVGSTRVIAGITKDNSNTRNWAKIINSNDDSDNL